MTDIEKVKKIRDITMSPMNKISVALKHADGDVDKAIEILLQDKQADAMDMANRVASASIVHSYVHNNKIGAMIVLSCQTDFVAKNEVFLNLAKDICMHIASSPAIAHYVAPENIPVEVIGVKRNLYLAEVPTNKPESIKQKIVEGKIQKFYDEWCLINQKFVKDETVTIKQLIQSVSATVGEKIELKKFVKLTTNL